MRCEFDQQKKIEKEKIKKNKTNTKKVKAEVQRFQKNTNLKEWEKNAKTEATGPKSKRTIQEATQPYKNACGRIGRWLSWLMCFALLLPYNASSVNASFVDTGPSLGPRTDDRAAICVAMPDALELRYDPQSELAGCLDLHPMVLLASGLRSFDAGVRQVWSFLGKGFTCSTT